MCGIIGYSGNKKAASVLLNGLRQLEYRGYDSVGMAILDSDKIEVRKDIGKVDEVNSKVNFEEILGSSGIAHSRWATTGKVTKENSHPHYSSDESFSIVHNGIVENYTELKQGLVLKGYSFVSETDSEVIAKLIEEEIKVCEGDVLKGVRSAFQNLKGRNSIVFLNKNGGMIGLKNGSPLVLGISDEEFFLASDVCAFLEYTKEVIFLEDFEGVFISNGGYSIFDAYTGESIEKEITYITWDKEQAKKGDYEHYMLKEILEQGHSIKDALAQDRNQILEIAELIKNSFGTYAVACGTAGKVCLYSTYIFSFLAEEHINFTFGSEFDSCKHFLKKDSLLITISQSGETADTLEAMEVAKRVGAKVLSIVNVMGSTIMRKSDSTLLVNAGPEIAVCSTKATTGQMAIMSLLAYAVSGKYEEGKKELEESSDKIASMLDESFCLKIKELADLIKDNESMYVIGRGNNYPMAMESAIKIQEVSYIHAEGFPGGELKHGPIALIGERTPLIVLAGNDEFKDEILSNALEVKARGGYIIGVAPFESEVFDYHIKTPDLGDNSGLVNIIPIQLLAYYLATAKGLDPDKPRNLAKSVTVK